MPCPIRSFVLFMLLLSALANGAEQQQAHWTQSYDAGHEDLKGAYAGGSEIMHIVSHKGKLYASNGYWVDAHWVIPPDGQKQSAQVLRLDSLAGKWQVDLDMGQSNDRELAYMKGNILKSVTFTRDASGKPLPSPENLLIMAAGANFERGGAVSSWTRNDKKNTWVHTLVRHGSSVGGIRWVPRDMEVYRDKKTGIERIFLSLGNPGIVSGVYDPTTPGKIRWSKHLEFPFPEGGSLHTRPLGIVQANGSLLFSEGGAIFRRVDGEKPRYEKIIDLNEDTDTDVGGIRGLTVIDNPQGKGQSLLFLWAPGDRSKSQVKRLDPDGKGGYTVKNEAMIMELMKKRLGVEVPYTLGAHNMAFPFTDPASGQTVHLIGFQGNIKGKHHLKWKGSALYGGALYAVRYPDLTYKVLEVNNAYASGKPVLVSPRTFCLSPFGDKGIFIGGHDSSRKISDDMAWIFHAPLEVALGATNGQDAKPSSNNPKPAPRLLEGPLYELRIYQASEGRFQHLIKRFREHTDRIFKKHGLKALGYWIPTDGSVKKRRKFVYLLQHPSRYEAYRNWTNFFNDKEWERVMDKPEFQGLLSEKPTSIFLSLNDYSVAARNDIEKPGGSFELRTDVVNPGKLPMLNARFRKHTTSLFNQHGIQNVSYWTPFDQPDSKDTLIYLVHHANRKQADLNWEAFGQDPEWKKVARESQIQGKLLARPPERLYLKALDFSPLR
tara:strand:- start:409 stop:2562 length:2154 start_codon:yes stop_codon:yes gene_type:complete